MSCFIAVDVETSNSSRASICQLGLVAIDNETEIWRWSSYIDPEEDFETDIKRIHNIGPKTVRGAPTFPEVLDAVASSIAGRTLVCWTSFDQHAIHHASDKYMRPRLTSSWLDAKQLSKSVWPSLPDGKLITVAEYLGIQFTHHDALEDAATCAAIASRALRESQRDIDSWLHEFGQASVPEYAGPAVMRFPVEIAREGKPGLPLSDHVVLFTGDFSIGKSRLGELANSLGCTVKCNFSKKVTLLVTGALSPERVGRDLTTKKLQDAEAARAAGQAILIVSEIEFIELLVRLGVRRDQL